MVDSVSTTDLILAMPKPDGHFASASAKFQLTLPDLGVDDTQRRVFQVYNRQPQPPSDDPGCFVLVMLTAHQVQLSLCGHDKPNPTVKPVSWVSGVVYSFELSYQAPGNVELAVFKGGTLETKITRSPGVSIYGIGQGLAVRLFGATTATGMLPNTTYSNVSLDLSPGPPFCSGYPFPP